ncbi:MFS transporter, NHS family, nucleoside permease [Xylanibacter ruminicola]|jgi:NHS family nucleoside permease-like MFS transporter|uniref:MFS transporter, NHS family, nucleoside permease n=1 Tax=Xylanibacter ruminicola TaxID=839 RepID=A0A1M7DD58_XYLRU|nr:MULTISPECIES: MFS transporter [Prevotellaceae]MBQ3312833.1 MFS transporter [Prevotella sp.]MBQ4412611.1 MFS transporter [Prevotella sp.]MBR0187403.1 MFS transporter [Prevotella sp.]SFB92767.1 MFS transporter, NHS family, nucleoside permease [Xylanibacter ruminicola]SHL77456.1 MFS transporter, NHS family, nucleoside permease [Xylanibacter ruminicola]
MNLKFRLSLMNFLEFAVWGAYLTCMGNYLGVAGLGDKISWFYAIQGIVSIFMPTLMGIVADKYIQPQRLLGLCHLAAGGFMLGCWWLGLQAGFGNELADKSLFITLYTLSVAFFMPTIALSNTAAFTILKNNGLDTVKDFPPIRVLGTVGFIVTMWFVNCAVWQDGSFSMTLADSAYKFQYTYMQFFVSGILSIVLCFYCFTLPECKVVVREKVSLIESLGLNAFKLFKSRNMALFFIFSALLGMCLQVTNGYAGPFITSFKGSADAAIASSFAANNATLLTSISQISEALCILMIPFFLKRYGIKIVMLMSMFAWVFRFGFFGVGNPAMPGVIMFILSCIVYGVAFDFFNVSGGIFVDQECEPSIKASAQGLFMMMTNGVGATVGTLAAGEIVNHYCYWENGFLQGEWTTCWFIFAAFALAVGISFALVFHPEKK